MPTINDRARLAADATSSDVVLRELSTDKSPKVRATVAGNPNTPGDLLGVLANDTSWRVRFAVGENPNPDAGAAALASTHLDTRLFALQRSDLDAAVLSCLQVDPDHRVREVLARGTVDPEALAALARDAHPSVRAATLQNPRLSASDVEMLAADRIASVRAAAAFSRRVHRNTLTRLADDRSARVRWVVLVSNPERVDLAIKLADDSDEFNAAQARGQITNPRETLLINRRISELAIGFPSLTWVPHRRGSTPERD